LPTKKKVNRTPTLVAKPPKNEDEFTVSEDALNLATIGRLPPRFNLAPAHQRPDTILGIWEELELLEKVLPIILTEKKAELAFRAFVCEGESLRETARILKRATGGKFSLHATKSLVNNAKESVRLFYDEAAKKVRRDERLEKAARRGNIAS
jgi:hypothetical protein